MAKRGGGPKTPAGKARSSRNALRHCLTSNAPVIPEMESDEEYQRHVGGFMADFAPEGYVEEFYVERLASLLWRLRRVTRHEVAAIMQNILSVPNHMYTVANLYADRSKGFIDPDPEEVEARQHNTVLPTASEMHKVAQYEAHVQRQVVQTLRQLLVLQARRRGDPMYFPRFALTGSADTRDPAVPSQTFHPKPQTHDPPPATSP